MKTKSALPWFGSDASVAPAIAEYFNNRKHVTIPFAGGMSILPHLTATHIVANDLHDDAIRFYDVLRGNYGQHERTELIRLCETTLSHPAHLRNAEKRKQYEPMSGIAWAFWARCWIGRKGKGGTKNQGGLPSVRRTPSGGSNASRLRSAAADLETWAEEFKRCEFTCEDFRECLSKVADDERCAVYLDPPWFGAGDGYRHTFARKDHVEMRDAVLRFQETKVLIRYGDCDEVRSLYGERFWNIHEATSRTQANKPLGELWITNIK